MDKAFEMGKTSATGSFRLFLGKAASTIILAAGTIIVGRLILDTEYGLYAISLVPALMISLFQDWGIGSAMTKYVAHSRATNKTENIRDIIIAGLAFEITSGIALTLLSIFLSNFIASTIFQKPEATPLISFASITIFATSLLTTSQSVFVGYEKMEFNSLILICQATLQTTVSSMLVILGYGAMGVLLGYAFSILAAGIIGIITLYFVIFKNIKRNNTSRSDKSQVLRAMLHYGIPLSISSIVGGFLLYFYQFVMASFCNEAIIGQYRIATNFTMLLAFFTFPIATVLFPAFAKIDSRNEHQLLKNVFASSVKYTSLFLVPATMAVMVLSEPMITTLYGEKWIQAPFFLTLYVLSNLFVVFGSLIMGSFLAGLGETRTSMKLSLLTLAFGLPLAFILVPTMGIVGVILGTLFAGLPSTFFGLLWIWDHYKVKADFRSSTKIFAASSIAALATYLFLIFFSAAEWIRLVVGGIIFLAIYIFSAPAIGAVSQSDIDNLRVMFSGLGIISNLLEIPLTLAEKPLKMRQTS